LVVSFFFCAVWLCWRCVGERMGGLMEVVVGLLECFGVCFFVVLVFLGVLYLGIDVGFFFWIFCWFFCFVWGFGEFILYTRAQPPIPPPPSTPGPRDPPPRGQNPPLGGREDFPLAPLGTARDPPPNPPPRPPLKTQT